MDTNLEDSQLAELREALAHSIDVKRDAYTNYRALVARYDQIGKDIHARPELAAEMPALELQIEAARRAKNAAQIAHDEWQRRIMHRQHWLAEHARQEAIRARNRRLIDGRK